MFPSPRAPRNILTNETMTSAQLISVLDQLVVHRLFHWSFGAFRHSSFRIHSFERLFKHPLRIHAVNSVFARPTSDTAISIIYDMIEGEHDYHGKPFNSVIYKWALNNRPYHHLIVRWRALAYTFYMIEIECADRIERERQQNLLVAIHTMRLCRSPIELIREKKLQDVAAAGEAAEPST
jgi:hypothetical protein